MSHQTSYRSVAEPTSTVSIFKSFVRAFQQCSEMQRSVKHYSEV